MTKYNLLVIIPRAVMQPSLIRLCADIIISSNIPYQNLIPDHLEETLNQMKLEEEARIEREMNGIYEGDLWSYNNWYVSKLLRKYEKNFDGGPYGCHDCVFDNYNNKLNFDAWSDLARKFKTLYNFVPATQTIFTALSPSFDIVADYKKMIEEWTNFTIQEREDLEIEIKDKQRNCTHCNGSGVLYESGFYKETNKWDYYMGRSLFNKEFMPNEETDSDVCSAQYALKAAQHCPVLCYALLDDEGWHEASANRTWMQAKLFYPTSHSENLYYPYEILTRLEKAANNGDFVTLIMCHC